MPEGRGGAREWKGIGKGGATCSAAVARRCSGEVRPRNIKDGDGKGGRSLLGSGVSEQQR